MRKVLLCLSFIMLAGCNTSSVEQTVAEQATAAQSAGQYDFQPGRDYRLLEQPITGTPDVIELFYYGCRACYYLTDELHDWSISRKASLHLMPAHSEERLVDGARFFHTFAEIGRPDLHVDTYVLFQEPSELQGEERINALLDQRGVDREVFWQAWSSEAVSRRLANSYQLTLLAGVSSTPAFIVKGKYVVEMPVFEGSEKILALLDHLLQQQ